MPPDNPTRHHSPRIEPWFFDPPIAHRGLHGRAPAAPENSLLAFELASAANFAIELDIQPSADGQPLVFHDATLNRMTGSSGALAGRAAAELSRIRLINGGGARIPYLTEVLDLLDGRVPLYIEIKSWRRGPGRCEARIAELLAAYDGPVAVQSFDPAILGWFAHFAPFVRRGQIATQSTRANRARLSWPECWRRAQLSCNAQSRPDFIAYDIRGLSSQTVRRARFAGLPVMAWTVRDAATAARARRYADNILFEGFNPAAESL